VPPTRKRLLSTIHDLRAMPPRINDGLTKYQRYRLRHPGAAAAANKKYYESHRTTRREARKLEYAKNKVRARFDNTRRWYGVTQDDYERMIAEQGYACAICRVLFSELKQTHQPSIEHNHTTGKVRGVLCQKCNLRLASVEDTEWLTSAQRYLIQTEKQE